MATTWFSAPAPVARRVRGYFAPVNRATATPTVFDPTEQGAFALDSPPAPWISLGWIEDFTRKSSSRTAPVLAGIPAATLEQVRESLQAQVSLQFLSWTKLTMALATGAQHMNLLAPATGAAGAADGAQGTPAVVVQTGSTATFVALAATDAAKFSPGAIIALDIDYTGQIGYVGSPVSGAYVRQARYLQCGVGICRELHRTYTRGAATRRRACRRSQVTSSAWIYRPRGRKFLPGVVGAVCSAGQPGRESLLPLSSLAADDERRRGLRSPQREGCKWAGARTAQGAVHGASGHRSAGWRTRALLPQLSSRSQRPGITRPVDRSYRVSECT
jgi:hypothetical protein